MKYTITHFDLKNKSYQLKNKTEANDSKNYRNYWNRPINDFTPVLNNMRSKVGNELWQNYIKSIINKHIQSHHLFCIWNLIIILNIIKGYATSITSIYKSCDSI